MNITLLPTYQMHFSTSYPDHRLLWTSYKTPRFDPSCISPKYSGTPRHGTLNALDALTHTIYRVFLPEYISEYTRVGGYLGPYPLKEADKFDNDYRS
ncbi:hypothetical protein SAMD00023353_4400240 [Rosellinia necatrix]|uniref:Uncharacterized protein n=1 Tax=Rosellinia necatrix TaxID=77044 RepID=A0A1S8AAG2_ROSNE|nr:hypothetical protein SAMD00023353_4400240 [Rosellinia necatrix]